jgi:hypothetical protein
MLQIGDVQNATAVERKRWEEQFIRFPRRWNEKSRSPDASLGGPKSIGKYTPLVR